MPKMGGICVLFAPGRLNNPDHNYERMPERNGKEAYLSVLPAKRYTARNQVHGYPIQTPFASAVTTAKLPLGSVTFALECLDHHLYVCLLLLHRLRLLLVLDPDVHLLREVDRDRL